MITKSFFPCRLLLREDYTVCPAAALSVMTFIAMIDLLIDLHPATMIVMLACAYIIDYFVTLTVPGPASNMN